MRIKLLALFMSSGAGLSFAQMIGTDAYMKGNYVEIGIAGAGGFEGAPTSTSPPPAGMHFRSGNPYFGFVANPQMDGWTNFDGDFFTPGSPENGWGFELDSVGGIRGNNNCSYVNQVPGSITYYNYSSPMITCEWEGDATSGTDIHFKINYSLNENNLYYITTVYATNNTLAPITDFYYHRNIDPDNNQPISMDFTTTNTVVSQITLGGANTWVSATSAVPWTSTYDLIAVDPDWKAGYGGFSNRSAYQAYNGASGLTQTVGSTLTADIAVFLAYHIPVLNPGSTGVFKFATVFDPSATSAAISELSSLTTGIIEAGEVPPVILYPNPVVGSVALHIDRAVSLQNARMIVYDMLGKEISRMPITAHDFSFEREGLPSGIYFYQITNDGAELSSGKMVMK